MTSVYHAARPGPDGLCTIPGCGRNRASHITPDQPTPHDVPSAARYVQITVHRDALGDALLALGNLLARFDSPDGGFWDGDLRAIQHVLDPLPEPDIYGYTPNIRYNVIPADFDILAAIDATASPDSEWARQRRDGER